ncbi:DUF5107 domain-containing protein, partial [Flavobacteriaceae bacterium]|nr:DUF5107 domain-containing protein [Flavobacteriaceae bacterium]
MDVKIITLENEFIKVSVLPEFGGKVWGAENKSNGNEFIYKNEVLKFRNIAMRGPWTSGGIEFNFGIIGHHPSTASAVDYHLEKLENGDLVCTVGTIDLPSRTQWRVKIILPKKTAAFKTAALWYNPTAIEQAYYNWMTAAAEAKDDLIFETPGNQYLKHDGNPMSWPVDGLNRKLSNYRENNFGPSKSYHVVGEYNDFFGGYYTKSDVGFGHWSRYDEIPGQKLWLWALSRSGGIWEDLLTDTDGQYIEYQAGRLFVQYFPGTENPMSQTTFEAHQTDQWNEVWFPIKDIGGLKEASNLGAMNVVEKNDSIYVQINPFITVNAAVAISSPKGKLHQNKKINPDKAHHFQFAKSKISKPYKVDVDSLNLHYTSQPQEIKRPFKTPAHLKGVLSNEKLFLEAADAKRYREFKKAKNLLKKVLENDPFHLNAQQLLGELLYREGTYKKALKILTDGLSVDSYHPGINYTAGINYMAEKDWLNAKECFGWAARSLKYRSSANAHLSHIALVENDLKSALHYANESLKFNSINSNALAQKAIAYRILGDNENAYNTLEKMEVLDPLNHLISYERFLHNTLSKDQLIKKHRSEFPYQTFLELALFYYNRGMLEDAKNILEIGPDHLLNNLWLAYMNQSTEAMEKSLKKSVAFVFPFRNESLRMLSWAHQNSKHWKTDYLLGLNLLGLDQNAKGLALFKALKNKPDTALFYQTRAALYQKHNDGSATPDLLKAYQMDPKNWRIAFAFAKDLLQQKKITEATSVVRKALKVHPENYILGMLEIQLLNKLGKYDEAISALKVINILPYEHATEGRKIYTEAYIGKILKLINKREFEESILLLKNSLEWPENLGVGKPYNTDERLENFLLAYCYQNLGQEKAMKKVLKSIVEYSLNEMGLFSKNHLLGLYAIEKLNGKDAVKSYLEKLRKSVFGNDQTTDALFRLYFENPSLDWNQNLPDTLINYLQKI